MEEDIQEAKVCVLTICLFCMVDCIYILIALGILNILYKAKVSNNSMSKVRGEMPNISIHTNICLKLFESQVFC